MYTQLSTFHCCLTDHARQTTIFIVLQRKADRPKTGSSGGGEPLPDKITMEKGLLMWYHVDISLDPAEV